jgi:hypothetical protein
VVPEEAELITGGEYTVDAVDRVCSHTTARLRWSQALTSR